MWAGQGLILPLEKRVHLFLGPWLLVCQFIEVSDQMELNSEVSNIEQKNYTILSIYIIINVVYERTFVFMDGILRAIARWNRLGK